MNTRQRMMLAALAVSGLMLTATPARADLLDRVLAVSGNDSDCDCKTPYCCPQKGADPVQRSCAKRPTHVQRASDKSHAQCHVPGKVHVQTTSGKCAAARSLWSGFGKAQAGECGPAQHGKDTKKSHGFALPAWSLPKISLPQCGLLCNLRQAESKSKADVNVSDEPSGAPTYDSPMVDPPAAPRAVPGRGPSFGDPVPVPPDPDATA